jgi:hypothetical protein
LIREGSPPIEQDLQRIGKADNLVLWQSAKPMDFVLLSGNGESAARTEAVHVITPGCNPRPTA